MHEHRDRQPIRVVVVDDHPILREGTRTFLERAPEVEAVAAAGDGASALALVAQHQPDVLLLDVHLPDMSGVEVTRRVREEFPGVAVLILTGYDDMGYARALLQLGVQGYLRKTVSGEEMLAAIRAVAEGRTVLISEMASKALGSENEPLTPREQEVLQLLAAGRRNAEIASALAVSVKTVEFHISHVLEKLGARSRAEAIGKALQLGLVLLEGSSQEAR